MSVHVSPPSVDTSPAAATRRSPFQVAPCQTSLPGDPAGFQLIPSLEVHVTDFPIVDVGLENTMSRSLVSLRTIRSSLPWPIVSSGSFSQSNPSVETQIADTVGVVGVWALDLAELIDIAESRLTRGFTQGECETYAIEPCPADQ